MATLLYYQFLFDDGVIKPQLCLDDRHATILPSDFLAVQLHNVPVVPLTAELMNAWMMKWSLGSTALS